MTKNKKQIVVAVSGAFDPIHIGHIRLIKEARKLGDRLVVILNNDNWLQNKKTHVFMHQKERKEILEAIEEVDEVIVSGHSVNPKDMSISAELLKIKPDIFVKGGDRKNLKDVPESEACRKIGCKIVFNVGHGGNFHYSSWLLANYIRSLNRAKQIDINKTLTKIRKTLKQSKMKVSLNIKLALSEIVLNTMNRRRAFGLFVILGWNDKWNSFTDTPDSGQDIYKKHHVNLKDLIVD